MRKRNWICPIGAAGFAILGVCLLPASGHRFLGLISFGVVGLVLVYWLLSFRNGKAFRFFRRGLTFLLALGVLLSGVTGILIAAGSRGTQDASCEYVIVLGAGLKGREPSQILRERLETAAAYLKANPETVCVVSGGQGPGEEITEAACMQAYLMKAGIGPERILLEDKATSTWENLEFSLAVIERMTGARPASVGVISSEFHLFRAGFTADKMALEIVKIPARTETLSYRINYFLREIAAVWKYAVLGG